MTELEQNRIFDISYEMRGLAATLVAASRGDIQDPERVVEFAAGQVDRLAGKTPKRPHKDRPGPDIQ